MSDDFRKGRRAFVCRLGGLALAPGCALVVPAKAQDARKLPIIGFLSPALPTARTNKMFMRGLDELGYADGGNVVIAARYADGNFDRLPSLAQELVALPASVIAAAVTQASIAARAATPTIPIVMLGVSDPIGAKLIAGLARPGGNVTGTSSMSSGVIGKSIEVLAEAIPGLARVAILWNPANAVFQAQMMREAEATAAALKLRHEAHAARGPHEYESAFTAIVASRAQALLVMPDPILTESVDRIIALARRARLPAIYGSREQAAAGGLMSYGPDIPEQFRRGAAYVDKILKGAKPGDLPVEQSDKFELVVNLKAAAELGLDLPNTLLVRADAVIE